LPPPPPPGRSAPARPHIETDLEDTLKSGISLLSGSNGDRTKHTLASLWKSQQPSPMASDQDGEDDGGDGEGSEAPPPPPGRPGPAAGPGLDSDLFEGSLHSVGSTDEGGRRRITLGGLAQSSQNMAGNMKGKVNSPGVNSRAKPKRVAIATRQPNLPRPDVLEPPRPPPMPPVSPNMASGRTSPSMGPGPPL